MLGSLHIFVNKFLFGYYCANQGFNRRHFVLFNEPFLPKENKRSCTYVSNQLQSPEIFLQQNDDGVYLTSSHNTEDFGTLQSKPKMFKNRFLDFVRLGSVLNNAAESFFKSEIRRRLFVTAVLIVISHVS
ncbi:unnamed protein product [Camellia sinensis]